MEWRYLQVFGRSVTDRNFVAGMLADAIFVPFACKGTKTFTTVKKLLPYKIPLFTTTHETNADLHALGVPALTRNSVRKFLDDLGAPLPASKKVEPPPVILPEIAPTIVKQHIVSDQLPLWGKKHKK